MAEPQAIVLSDGTVIPVGDGGYTSPLMRLPPRVQARDWRSDMDVPQPTGELREWDPEAPIRRLRQQGVDSAMTGPRLANEVVMQPVRAAQAVGEAYDDPSIANMTNAGVQTGMALFRPQAALLSLAGGYGAAAAEQFGLNPFSAAHADPRRKAEIQAQIDRLVADKNRILRGKIRGEGEEAAARARALAESFDSQIGVLQEELSGLVKNEQAATAASEADKRALFNRRQGTAERAYADEMRRDRRYSDTPVGQVWDKTGGWGPALVGLGLGKASRLATGGGTVAKDYLIPGGVGMVGGAAANNIPLAYNAFATEQVNPQRAAIEAYIREAPDGDPRKEELERLLASPAAPERENPVRKQAADELYDPQKAAERMLFGAIEGLGGGMLGSDAARIPGRVTEGLAALPGRALTSYRRALPPRSRRGAGEGPRDVPPDRGPGGRQPDQTPPPEPDQPGGRTAGRYDRAGPHGAVARQYLDELLSANQRSRVPLAGQPDLVERVARNLEARFHVQGLPPVDPRDLRILAERSVQALRNADQMVRQAGRGTATAPGMRPAVLDAIQGNPGMLAVPLAVATGTLPFAEDAVP